MKMARNASSGQADQLTYGPGMASGAHVLVSVAQLLLTTLLPP